MIQSTAIRAMGTWGSEKNTAALVELLDHEQAPVRWAAIDALGKLKDSKAAAPLAKLLADRTDRAHAGQALQQLGSEAKFRSSSCSVPKPGGLDWRRFAFSAWFGSAKSRIALAKAPTILSRLSPAPPRCGDGAAE